MHTFLPDARKKSRKAARKVLGHQDFQVPKRVTHPDQKFLRERATENCACCKSSGEKPEIQDNKARRARQSQGDYNQNKFQMQQSCFSPHLFILKNPKATAKLREQQYEERPNTCPMSHQLLPLGHICVLPLGVVGVWGYICFLVYLSHLQLSCRYQDTLLSVSACVS